MSTKTVIGKRELFAWIERHTKKRLKDYTDLADGSVFCLLFSLVFGKCRIKPVASSTHSHSQRAQMNWSNFNKGMSLLGVPTSLVQRILIDPLASAAANGVTSHIPPHQHQKPFHALQQDEQHCFCAIALFYFLYHVGKMPGFTAEFQTDLTDEVADYLQSMDSIQALVLGGGMEIGKVPEPLRSAILRSVRDGRSDEEDPSVPVEGAADEQGAASSAAHHRAHGPSSHSSPSSSRASSSHTTMSSTSQPSASQASSSNISNTSREHYERHGMFSGSNKQHTAPNNNGGSTGNTPNARRALYVDTSDESNEAPPPKGTANGGSANISMNRSNMTTTSINISSSSSSTQHQRVIHHHQHHDGASDDGPKPPPRLSPSREERRNRPQQREEGGGVSATATAASVKVRWSDNNAGQPAGGGDSGALSSSSSSTATAIASLQHELLKLQSQLETERNTRIAQLKERDAKVQALHQQGSQLLEETAQLRTALAASREAEGIATRRANVLSEGRASLPAAMSASPAPRGPLPPHSSASSSSSQSLPPPREASEYAEIRRRLIGSELPSVAILKDSRNADAKGGASDDDPSASLLASALPNPSLEAMDNATGTIYPFDPIAVATELAAWIEEKHAAASSSAFNNGHASPPTSSSSSSAFSLFQAKDKLWMLVSAFQTLQSRLAGAKDTFESLVADRNELLGLVKTQQVEMDAMEAENRALAAQRRIAEEALAAAHQQNEALVAENRERLTQMSAHHRNELLKVYEGFSHHEDAMRRLQERDVQWKVLCASLRRLRNAQTEEEMGEYEAQAAKAVEKLSSLDPAHAANSASPSKLRAQQLSHTVAALEKDTIALESALIAEQQKSAQLQRALEKEASVRASSESVARENDEANSATCEALRSKVQALLNENCLLEMRTRQTSQELTEVKRIWSVNAASVSQSMQRAGSVSDGGGLRSSSMGGATNNRLPQQAEHTASSNRIASSASPPQAYSQDSRYYYHQGGPPLAPPPPTTRLHSPSPSHQPYPSTSAAPPNAQRGANYHPSYYHPSYHDQQNNSASSVSPTAAAAGVSSPSFTAANESGAGGSTLKRTLEQNTFLTKGFSPNKVSPSKQRSRGGGSGSGGGAVGHGSPDNPPPEYTAARQLSSHY